MKCCRKYLESWSPCCKVCVLLCRHQNSVHVIWCLMTDFDFSLERLPLFQAGQGAVGSTSCRLLLYVDSSLCFGQIRRGTMSVSRQSNHQFWSFYQKFSLGFLGRSFPLMTAMHTIGASRWQDLFNDVPPWWHHSIDFPTGTSGTSGTRHCLFVVKYHEVVFGAMPAIPLAMPTSGSLSDFLAASWTVAQSTPSMPTSRQVGSFTAGRDCFGD